MIVTKLRAKVRPLKIVTVLAAAISAVNRKEFGSCFTILELFNCTTYGGDQCPFILSAVIRRQFLTDCSYMQYFKSVKVKLNWWKGQDNSEHCFLQKFL